jgi:hypothetical protein
MTKGKRQLVKLGDVPLGAKFVFRSVEILGPQYHEGFKPPFEGQVLTVVGFKPRLVNNVVVRDANGYEGLLPLDMVEKGLKLNNSRWPLS